MSYWFKRVLLGVGLAALLAPAAQANHQWSNYHWNKDGVPVRDVTVGDNHNTDGVPNWPDLFDTVIGGFAVTVDVDGFYTDVYGWPDYTGTYFSFSEAGGSGDVESYNGDYGNNGWLGIASIWVSRGKNKHITRGESKVNDYYVTLDGYDGFNEEVEWLAVLCQEIGHTVGLAHTTTDNSCMNTEDRPLRYPDPNGHDTDMLDSAAMYGHDHGGGDGGGDKPKKCHPVFGCAGTPGLGHAVWAEHYDTDEEMFDAADAVVDVTVLSSNFDRMAGRGRGAVPVTRVVLRVEDTLSGFTRPVIVLEQTRGAGLELEDDPGYVQGDSYTLYLREIGHNTYRTVNPNGRIRN